MSFVLYIYHGIIYLCTATDLDALCNEGVVVQWMCMEDEGRHTMGWKSNGWEWVESTMKAKTLNSVGTFNIVIFASRS